jgi:transcriptional regulator with PAS, ATPase and Fis domain
LENTLERVIITSNNWSELGLCDFNMILNNKDCSDVNTLSNGTSYPDSLLKGGKIMKLKDAEMIIIESALNCYGRSYTGKQEAASALGISIATLYNKIKEYRLE